ncbi:hypothetical protein [Saccharopolyspora griseoalba]|uniref:Uncharacterized protein n=1 Tax=Saccharopolyspora griseoalba TaxID=1431848 RepID=A0ABW2LU59_9PSEU
MSIESTTMGDLDQELADLKVGEHITATGMDTRGWEVTRVGYLLAEPKQATYNKQPVWRLFVGPKGLSPEEKSCWVTLVPGKEYKVARIEEPDPNQWHTSSLGSIPGVRAASYTPTIRFGGKAAARSTSPEQDVLATVHHVDGGKYEIRSEEGDELLAGATLGGTKIWWRYVLN